MSILRTLTNPFTISGDLEKELATGTVRLLRLQFPGYAFEGIRCFQVTGPTAEGTPTHGLGTDRDLGTAILKAYVEYVERRAFFDRAVQAGFDSTNGIAAHRFYSLAKAAAIAEVYERDSFLLHWYGQVPFAPLTAPPALSAAIQELAAKKYRTLFARTTLGAGGTVVCALVRERDGGFVIGLSAGKGLAKDLEKAFTEAIVNLSFGNYGRSEEQIVAELREKGFHSLEHHRAYWLHLASLPEGLFPQSHFMDSEATVIPPVKAMEIFREKRGNVRVVGVRSENCLGIEIGPIKNGDLSLLKSRLLCHSVPAEQVLQKHPHPIP